MVLFYYSMVWECAKKRIVKSELMILLSLTLLFLPSQALANEALSNANHSQYEPNKIIVKFKANVDAATVAPYLIEKDISFESIAPSKSLKPKYKELDTLNAKHRVQEMRPLLSKNVQSFNNAKTLKNINARSIRSFAKKERSKFKKQARFKKNQRKSSLKSRSSKRKTRHIKTPSYSGRSYLVEINSDEQDIEKVCAEYKESLPDIVEYAVPNYMNKLHFTPNDSYFSSSASWGQTFNDMYGLQQNKLNCQAAWDSAQGYGTVVAVLDTGADYNHADLSQNIWINQNEIPGNFIDDDSNGYADDVMGYDFSDSDSDPLDYHGHGTHCAGTIAGVGNNNLGVIGVAPLAKIMPIKIFPWAYDNVIVEAIHYAADNGADILSNSWGPLNRRLTSPAVEDAIDYAHNLGCTIIFAAGNDYHDDIKYYAPNNYGPSRGGPVISVAATDPNDQVTYFSTIGNDVSVSAPGYNILSLRASGTDMYGDGLHIVGNDYYHANGTSMACPHIAGVAALILSNSPTISKNALRNQIVYSANSVDNLNPGFENKLGKVGRVNAYQALTMTPTPFVEYVSQNINDQFNGNNNGEPDPGETFDLTVTIRQVWAQSLDSALATISSQNSHVTFSGPTTLSLGVLPLNQNVDLTFSVSLDSSTPRNDSVNFEIDIDFIQGQDPQTVLVSTEIPFLTPRPGWPQLAYETNDIIRSPVAADLDNDGLKEIISFAGSDLYVFSHDGNVLPGWPKNLEASMPAIADLDGDEDLEIVAYVYDGTSKGIHIWHHDGTSFSQAWPIWLSYGNSGLPPAIGDIDGNGQLDIVVTERHNFTGPKISVFNLNGTLMPGWPVNLAIPNAPTDTVSAPCLVDIDLDGDEDIVQAYYTVDTYQHTHPTHYSKIVALKENGQIYSGWNTNRTKIYSTKILGTPSAADIDDDGQPEIIFTTDNNKLNIYTRSGYAKHYKAPGSVSNSFYPMTIPWNNWTNVSIAAGSVVLADFDQDTKPEVIAISGGLPRLITVINPRTGEVVPGSWARKAMNNTIGSIGNHTMREPSSVVSVDLTGDNIPEILSQGGNYMYAYDASGTSLDGYRIETNAMIIGTPLVIDLDNDQKNEIIFRDSDGFLNVVEHPITVNPYCQSWPMAYHDLRNTSHYKAPTKTQTLSLSQGWNIISLNVIPDDLNVASIFSNIEQDIIMIKDEQGNVYSPAQSINQIGDILPEQGYQVKTSQQCNLTIEGIPFSISNAQRTLEPGWHIIGYPLDYPYPMSEIFSNLNSKIEIIKDEDGNIYWPSFGVDNIGDMQPGKGYQIKVSQSMVLDFAPNLFSQPQALKGEK